MSEPTAAQEARTLYGPAVNQQAIPWCTTHDQNDPGHGYCGAGLLQDIAERAITCVISTGGPDHKWWIDLPEEE